MAGGRNEPGLPGTELASLKGMKNFTEPRRDDSLTTVTIAVDGSCPLNPGPGGYAAILVLPDGRETVIHDGVANTTNNRMELLAVIAGLESLGEPSRVEVITDSLYVLKSATLWIDKWIRNDWKRGKVKNIDLWKRFLKAAEPHEISWEWVRAHSGHPLNEWVDAIAGEEARKDGSPDEPHGYTPEELRDAQDYHDTWLAKPVPPDAGETLGEIRPTPLVLLKILPAPIGGWVGEPVLCSLGDAISVTEDDLEYWDVA